MYFSQLNPTVLQWAGLASGIVAGTEGAGAGKISFLDQSHLDVLFFFFSRFFFSNFSMDLAKFLPPANLVYFLLIVCVFFFFAWAVPKKIQVLVLPIIAWQPEKQGSKVVQAAGQPHGLVP